MYDSGIQGHANGSTRTCTSSKNNIKATNVMACVQIYCYIRDTPYYVFLKNNCQRSELLFWQRHQFELGCIKLHTPYRYKVHPKLYSDWSMCTVFYKHRVEFLNTLQHRVESLWYSVVLSTSWLAGHVMLELKSVKVIHLLMTARQALRQLHCLSTPGI